MNADQRDIVELIVRAGIGAGFSVAVSGGDEDFIPPTRLRANVMNSVGLFYEEEYLTFYKNGKRQGWVYLVYNDGNDIVRDATDKPEIRALLGREEYVPEE